MYFSNHGPPQTRGFENVALVHGADLAAAFHGGLEADPGDAADFLFVVNHGVIAGAQAVSHLKAAGFTKVDVAGELTDNDEIKAVAGSFGAEQAGTRELGKEQGRAQIGEEAEGFADAEKSAFGAVFRRLGVPLGAAHCRKIYGVRGLAFGDGLFGKGAACGIDGGAADVGAVKSEGAAGLGADGFQNLAAFGQNFRAYAIAGKKADFLVHGICPQGGLGPPGSYFAWASRRDLT